MSSGARRCWVTLATACACGEGMDTTELRAAPGGAREVTLTPPLTIEPSLTRPPELPERPRGSLVPNAAEREPTPSEPSANASDPTDRKDAGPPADEAASVRDAEAARLPLPCTLRVDWGALQESHAGCESASGLPAAGFALWDGTALVMVGEEWLPEADTLERTRRCVYTGGTLWRFNERLLLGQSLPSAGCPELPITASYAYEECPLSSPGTVCAAREPSACRFSGSLTFTPVAEAVAADAFAAPPEEATCRPVGRNPRRPVAAGERCYDGECVEGHFCSQELGDGTCAPIGEGVCSPAPALRECGDIADSVCRCTQPPTPLSALSLFSSSGPSGDAPTPNTCTAHALGISVIPCPGP